MGRTFLNCRGCGGNKKGQALARPFGEGYDDYLIIFFPLMI